MIGNVIKLKIKYDQLFMVIYVNRGKLTYNWYFTLTCILCNETLKYQ